LINGAEGIGTGWSTSIPNYSPKQIVANLKHLMNDEPTEPMHPWYRGFKGTIKFNDKKQNYIVTGVYEKTDEDTLVISELPIGVWTQNYKEFLESLIETMVEQKKVEKEKEKKKKKKKDEGNDDEDEEKKEKPKKGKKKMNGPFVKDYKEYHTDTTVKFVVEFLPGKLAELEASGDLETVMKLNVSISINNMVLWDSEGRIRKYTSVDDVLKEFFSLRLRFYEKRKDFMINDLNEQWSMLDNKVRFLLAVIKEEIIVRNRKKNDLMNELAAKKYTPFYKKKKDKADIATEEDTLAEGKEGSGEEEEDEFAADDKARGYDYLLSMPLWNLTMEKVQQLIKKREAKQKELQELIDTPVKSLWERDLDAFETAYDVWAADEEALASQVIRPKKKRATKKRKQESDDDSEGEDYGKKSKVTKRPAIAKEPAKPKAETTKVTEKPKVDTTKTEKTKEKEPTDKWMSDLLKPKETTKPTKEKDTKPMDIEKPKVDSTTTEKSKEKETTKETSKPKSGTLDRFILKPTAHHSPTAESKTTKSTASKSSKESSKSKSILSDVSDSEPEVIAITKSLGKKDSDKPEPKKKEVISLDKEETTKSKRKPAAKKAAKSKDSDGSGSDSDNLYDELPAKASKGTASKETERPSSTGRSRRAATTKKPVYKQEESEEEESEEESSAEVGSDDDSAEDTLNNSVDANDEDD